MTHELTDEAKRLLEEYGSARWNAGSASASFDKLGEKRYSEEADESRAALLAHLAQRGTSPEGWKLVPVEPTPEMFAAAGQVMVTYPGRGYQDHERPLHNSEAKQVYRAMLAASPQAVQPMPDGVPEGDGCCGRTMPLGIRCEGCPYAKPGDKLVPRRYENPNPPPEGRDGVAPVPDLPVSRPLFGCEGWPPAASPSDGKTQEAPLQAKGKP